MGFPYIDLNHHMDYQNPWACFNLSSIVGGEHVPLADKEFFFFFCDQTRKKIIFVREPDLNGKNVRTIFFDILVIFNAVRIHILVIQV